MTDHRIVEQQVLEVRIFPNFLWIHVEACFLWIPTKPFLIGVEVATYIRSFGSLYDKILFRCLCTYVKENEQ